MGDPGAARLALVAAAAVAVLAGVVALAPGTDAHAPPAPAAELHTVPTPPGTMAAARAETPEDRHAMAGGCYAVQARANGRWLASDGAGGFGATASTPAEGEPFRFQATDLGRYLLYGTARDYLAVGGRSTPTPGPAADWTVDDAGDGSFRLTLAAEILSVGPDGSLAMAGGPAADVAGDVTAGFGFRLTDGCAQFPEVEVNVNGPHVVGGSPIAEVSGFVDAHLHVMAYEFLGGMVHCGRPWSAYGVTDALVDCPDHLIADGAGAVLENFLSHPIPLATHDTVGWPTFRDWPAPSSLTHEQVYYRWLERAWRSGLRIMVNLFTDNRVLCEIYPLKRNSCDEMESVRLQVQRTRELERYIDAQSGGPGEGWFRVVTDPFEARRVANEGKLAVILGIEISEPFGCRVRLGVAQCTEADIDAALDELDGLGIRQFIVIHKFDNAFGGVAGDGGTKGVVINLGNFYGTGRFWDFESCDPHDTGVHDNDQGINGDVDAATSLFGAILSEFGAGGALPLYPAPHHCNRLGLSPLGAYAIEAMIERGFVVDIDHMSVRARQEALTLLEAHGYSGVISSHSWATPDAYPRVYALGGFTAPYAGNSTGFAQAWRERREAADPRYGFGIGFGADANGLGAQGAPRGATAEDPVTYPFEGLGGVVIDRQVSGARIFDVNVDGVAHYGLYPDWIEDLRQLAGDGIVDDLARGSEAYLQMWERAGGVPGPGCRPDGLAALRIGMTADEVLRAAGQPDARRGSTYEVCGVALVFDGAGRLTAVPAAGVVAADARTDAVAPGLPATGGSGRATAAGGLLLAAVALLGLATAGRPIRSTAATAASRRRSPSRRR